MRINIIVFDFDGTLIDSNRLKYDAYFDLFPEDDRHRQIIRTVLDESFEQSRYIILEEILNHLGFKDKDYREGKVEELASHYNDITLSGAKTCPERKGAEETLRKLAPVYGLYISSTTPQDSLTEIIKYRKWDCYFRALFGYPEKKPEILRRIIDLEKVSSSQVLVVGDGESDRKSAMENGCPFIHLTERFHLEGIERMLATM